MNRYPIVWITGACGFTGRHLIDFIRSSQHQIYILAIDRFSECSSDVDEYVQLDISNAPAVLDLAKRIPPKKIFHLAVVLPPSDESTMWQVNVGGVYTIINGLNQAKCKGTRLLSIGSAAEYLPNSSGFYTEESQVGGNSSYGITKAAQSMLALKAGEKAGVDVIIARTFNLIGPGLSRNLVAGKICSELITGNINLTLGNIEAKRDFVDICDAIKANWYLMESASSNSIYNISSGIAVSIKEVVSIASKALNLEAIIKIDKNLIRKYDFDCSYGDPQKIYQEVEWRSEIPIEISIRDMIDELRNSQFKQ
jgi:nucleoside-diphosphate-sugar epimerase